MNELYDEFTRMREHYCGTPFKDEFVFDVELLINVIDKFKRDKAAGLDSLSAEHLINCHPIFSCILAKLFNLILRCSYILTCRLRSYSYTVALPKVSDYRTKSMSYSDFVVLP